MIEIRTERCTGCTACVEVCPVGALYLVDGKAAVDETLCRECDACISACPAEAILHVEPEPQQAAKPVPAPGSYLASQPAEVNIGTRGGLFVATVLPVVGAALKWEPSRGGALFPHFSGVLPLTAVKWSAPLPLGADGRHVFPELVA